MFIKKNYYYFLIFKTNILKVKYLTFKERLKTFFCGPHRHFLF